MKIVGEYSFNGGSEYVNKTYPDLLKEVRDCINSIDREIHKTKVSAYFGPSRSPVSVEGDHGFRRKPITRFGRCRSLVSVDADHPFRVKLITT